MEEVKKKASFLNVLCTLIHPVLTFSPCIVHTRPGMIVITNGKPVTNPIFRFSDKRLMAKSL